MRKAVRSGSLFIAAGAETWQQNKPVLQLCKSAKLNNFRIGVCANWGDLNRVWFGILPKADAKAREKRKSRLIKRQLRRFMRCLLGAYYKRAPAQLILRSSNALERLSNTHLHINSLNLCLREVIFLVPTAQLVGWIYWIIYLHAAKIYIWVRACAISAYARFCWRSQRALSAASHSQC